MLDLPMPFGPNTTFMPSPNLTSMSGHVSESARLNLAITPDSLLSVMAGLASLPFRPGVPGRCFTLDPIHLSTIRTIVTIRVKVPRPHVRVVAL